jgi:hypothetical protein
MRVPRLNIAHDRLARRPAQPSVLDQMAAQIGGSNAGSRQYRDAAPSFYTATLEL